MSPRALACPASLKGVLSAALAAEALVRGFAQSGVAAGAMPIGDGGEGTLDALCSRFEPVHVADAFGRPRIARTGFLEGPIYVPGFVLDELQHIADSADKATKIILKKQTRPDLVLLDVRMPRVDGWSVLGELRRRGETPVIMLTAISDTQVVNRAQQLGAKAYLVKATFSVAEMMSCVKQYTGYMPH